MVTIHKPELLLLVDELEEERLVGLRIPDPGRDPASSFLVALTVGLTDLLGEVDPDFFFLALPRIATKPFQRVTKIIGF